MHSSKLGQAVTFLNCIWEVPGSNLGWDLGFLIFVVYLSLFARMTGQYFEMGHDHFLSNPFNFTEHDHPITTFDAKYMLQLMQHC